jgi:hypothetical protein
VGTGGGGEGQGLSAPPGRRSGARGHHVIGHRLANWVESDGVGCFRPNIASRRREVRRIREAARPPRRQPMRRFCLPYRRRFDWTSSATQASMRALGCRPPEGR